MIQDHTQYLLENVPNWEWLFVNREKGLILFCVCKPTDFLLLPLHSNRIDGCLSLGCVCTEFVEVIRSTDHDDSFVFSCFNSDAELCKSGTRVAVTQQRQLDRRPAAKSHNTPRGSN